MPQILSTFQAIPSHAQTVTLGAAKYRVRLTWRERLRAWYLDLYDVEGTPIAVGRRLTPGWGPLWGLTPPGRPGGYLFVRGPDPYEREQLGAEVDLVYVAEDEVPVAPADPEAPTVVVL